MWRLGWIESVWPPTAGKQAAPGFQRDRLAALLALVTVVGLGLAFILSDGTQLLMPGQLASAHGGIEKCSACHTQSGDGKLSWAHGIVAGDPLADTKACLTCHKMGRTAFNAHGATAEVLKQSTKRLTKIAAQTSQPPAARAQNIAFPAQEVVAAGLYCATCHQEHKGVNFNLNKISNEQCRSCHVVKFDSFDGNHPKFDSYPFKQRTGIIYDHAGHFGKHYPELAKKDPAKRIPDTCSTCHNSREDKRVMAVAPFEQTCAGCHLGQIVGKERVSGPKGVAFLTLPGLDLQTLKKKNASVGEWPDSSDAALTPFMKVMISRNEQGRDLIKSVDGLNLQDLTNASDAQVKAVTKLAWEIKRIFYALIKGKASDVLNDFDISGGAKLAPTLVADLTANIPRDVVASAQQQWLPNLATEMANRSSVANDEKQSGWDTVVKELTLDEPASQEQQPGSDAQQANSSPAPQADREIQPEAVAGTADDANAKTDGDETRSAETASTASTDSKSDEPDSSEKASDADTSEEAASETVDTEKPRRVGLDPPVCTVRLFGQCLVTKEPETGAAKSDAAGGNTDPATAKPGDGEETRSANELPPAFRAGVKDAQPEATGGKTYTTNAGPDDGEEAPGGPIIRRLPLPSGTSRAIEGRAKEGGKSDQPEKPAEKPEAAKAQPDTGTEPPSAGEQPRATNADGKDAEKAGEAASAKAATDGGKAAISTNEQPQGDPADQKDDLLFPTEEELRGLKTDNKAAEKSAEPESAAGNAASATPEGTASPDAPASSNSAAAQPQPRATPVISIDSDVDPESWAEYGGWYRQDYAIFYRPTGHKDKFIYSWLFLTGPQAPKGGKSPAAAVFDVLTGKDAQGSCTKCHSVDDIEGKGRVVNFSPPSAKSKQGRFTNFIHEPHFSILETRGGIQENRGCMTCHELEKGRPYLKSYEEGNPQNSVSNFGEVKKDLCQTCHNASMARQDCLTCHKYHVNDVITPIISTKIPAQ